MFTIHAEMLADVQICGECGADGVGLLLGLVVVFAACCVCLLGLDGLYLYVST